MMRVWMAIWAGSSALSRLFWTWVCAGNALLRIGGVALAAGFAKGLPFTWSLIKAGAASWLLAAIVIGLFFPDLTNPPTKKKDKKDKKGKAKESPGDTQDEDDEDQAPGAEPTPAPDLTRQEVGDHLRAGLGPKGGVHLKSLAQTLTKAHPGTHWETRDVRALLDRVGVRVRPGVRGPDGKGREGVHRDDVPAPTPPPDQTAPEGVVAAVQPSNNNSNNTQTRRYPDGAVAVFTQDPVNPHHTHIQWSTSH